MLLIYHHVAPVHAIPKSQPADEAWNLNHTPEEFEAQLTALRSAGFYFSTLQGVVGRINSGEEEDPRSLVVTFDDGWMDQFAHAVPILKRLNIPAIFFVTTNHLRPEGAKDARRMPAEVLSSLVQDGMEIGAHSRSHPDLAALGAAAIESEVRGSKDDLESALGRGVEFFAYPGGSFNAGVVASVRRAQFEAATSSLGPARNDATSLFWMFRDTLSPRMTSPRDRYRLSTLAREVFEFRVRRRLRNKLRGQG